VKPKLLLRHYPMSDYKDSIGLSVGFYMVGQRVRPNMFDQCMALFIYWTKSSEPVVRHCIRRNYTKTRSLFDIFFTFSKTNYPNILEYN